jgi:hypothetical protein
MRLNRAACLLLALCAAGYGCGGEKAHKGGHEPTASAPGPAPPTPDTTPIEALRTPAGLVLKIDQAQTPVPAQTPTPGGR